jgi:hypothetical protein
MIDRSIRRAGHPQKSGGARLKVPWRRATRTSALLSGATTDRHGTIRSGAAKSHMAWYIRTPPVLKGCGSSALTALRPLVISSATFWGTTNACWRNLLTFRSFARRCFHCLADTDRRREKIIGNDARMVRAPASGQWPASGRCPKSAGRGTVEKLFARQKRPVGLLGPQRRTVPVAGARPPLSPAV